MWLFFFIQPLLVTSTQILVFNFKIKNFPLLVFGYDLYIQLAYQPCGKLSCIDQLANY